MARKLVTLRRITDLRPVPGSVQFQMAVIDGWTCAVRTGAFAKGELVLFFEIDSFLPPPAADKRYEPLHNPVHTGVTTFKGAKGIHVKSIMVNRTYEISQGVVLKVDAFPEVKDICDAGKEKSLSDMCFAEKLGVQKWEVAPGEAATSLGQAPVFFPKTGIERVQNVQTLFTNKYAKATFQESVKMDGSSMTVYFVRKDCQYYKSLPTLPETARKADMANGRVGVTSRKVDLSEADPKSRFWAAALRYGLPGKLDRLGKNVAIQGELVGASVNGNRHGYAAGEHDFFVFAIYNVDAQAYMNPREVELRAEQLGLKHVPVLGYVNIHQIAKTQEDLLKRAEGVGMNGKKREGLVYKNVEDGRWFKAIANDYLLAIGE
ncbi:RNA ligase, DRB0094 family [Hypoxylon sp. FL1150]|nr:RNA ligase, DRB0094 family [Hypoxylon sp. FL1150]